MLRWFTKPQQLPLDEYVARPVAAPVRSFIFGKRGTVWAEVALIDSFNAVLSAALANGAGFNLLNAPGAGLIFQVSLLLVSSSVAGQVTCNIGASAFAIPFVAANTPFPVIDYWPGTFLYPANSTLNIVNNTGAPADIRATVHYATVPA